MNTMTRTRFDVVPLTKHIGAEIRGLDLRDKPDDETIRAIYQAWLDHLVIVFPGQSLSQEDLIRVTGYFGELGELHRPAKYFPKGYSSLLPGIMLISNIRENGEPIGALPDGEMMFHHDMIHAEIPSKATLLYSVEIPSAGGNTLFASGYAAYDTLDSAIRHRLEGRKAMHHYNYGSTQKGDGRGTAAFGQSTHPVFRTPGGHRQEGDLRQPADDGRHRRHAGGGKRASAQRGVRPRREARLRLRARLARR
jgi:alpha-ketoglutarate-dependent taurine dioxygenase